MKYLNNNQIDELVKITQKHLTPEIKSNLYDLYKLTNQWFIYEQNENIRTFEWWIQDNILTPDEKITDSYIQTKYINEFNFLHSFYGFWGLLNDVNQFLKEYNITIILDLIDLLKCPDFYLFYTLKFSIQNIPRKELEKSFKISDSINFLLENVNYIKLMDIINRYNKNKEQSIIHNFLQP